MVRSLWRHQKFKNPLIFAVIDILLYSIFELHLNQSCDLWKCIHPIIQQSNFNEVITILEYFWDIFYIEVDKIKQINILKNPLLNCWKTLQILIKTKKIMQIKMSENHKKC